MNCNREYTLFAKGETLTHDIVNEINRWLEDRKLIDWVLCRGEYIGEAEEANERIGEWASAGLCWWETETYQLGYADDMRDLSIAFPDITFNLYCEGNEREDVWDGYWLNGECEMCWGRLEIPEPTRIKW